MRLCREVKLTRTPCNARMVMITNAVTELRTNTAVATSTP